RSSSRSIVLRRRAQVHHRPSPAGGWRPELVYIGAAYSMAKNKPLVLVILDGWGYAPPSNANAISLARKPTIDALLRDYPNTLIHTSGRYVGLPNGQMGNSEVGHLNIGAGRVVYMDITRIDLMIEKGDFFN